MKTALVSCPTEADGQIHSFYDVVSPDTGIVYGAVASTQWYDGVIGSNRIRYRKVRAWLAVRFDDKLQMSYTKTRKDAVDFVMANRT